jgi:uncharacterized protein YkwD
VLLLALLLGLPSQIDLEKSLYEAIAAACPGRKVAVDRDLTRACRAYTAAASSGKAPLSGPAISFYASLESSEPAPVAGIARVSPPSRADRAVGELFSRACRFNRVGVAAAMLPGNEAVICTLTADHETDLAPIPGRVEEFDVVQVKGTLAPGLTNPRMFVTRPTGEVEEIGLTASGGEFVTKVMLRETGEHSLEILADGPGGPQVVALRRVFAGVKPPDSPPREVKIGKGLDGVEAAIARLRLERGLPPLERDPVLDEVAEAHSREMAREHVFAHVLPADGTPGDRLRARGYAFRTAGENIGLAEDAGSAHEAIAGSPAHLANLLDPRHRRLGLGEARGTTPEGTPGVYLTEVLAAPIVASKDPATDVAGVVEAERKRRGLRPLQRDRTLDLVARQQVDAAAQADALKLSGDSAGMALQKVPELSSAVAELYVGGGADIVAASKNLADSRWTRLGVGAVYAASRENGPGRLWVVLLYGR